jgi:hypothetical protein
MFRNIDANERQKFNFRVNTFTHILEGTVADKMKEHGVGASTLQTGGLINLK